MSKEYIGQLTGIRIFLTLMVVISNMTLFRDVDPGFIQNTDWILFDIFSQVPFRVDIFFMLTGFLLFYIYEEEFSKNVSYKSYTKFILIRLARVYPVHFFALAVILILYLSGVWQSINDSTTQRVAAEGNWLLNLTLLNAWGLGEYKASWNGPSWSISIELFNYLLFPILAMIVFNLRKAWLTVFALVCVLAFYIYLQLAVIKDMGTYNGSTAIIRGFIGMTLGTLLAKIYASKAFENLPWDFIAMMTIAIMATMMTIFTIYDYSAYYLFYIPLPLLVMAVASSKKIVKKFFSMRFLVYLGNLSFCLYMLHQPISRIFHFLFIDYYQDITVADASNLIIGLNLLAVLLTMLVASALVYRYIETPLRIFLKKYIKSQ